MAASEHYDQSDVACGFLQTMSWCTVASNFYSNELAAIFRATERSSRPAMTRELAKPTDSRNCLLFARRRVIQALFCFL
jgi:hypothetical protein